MSFTADTQRQNPVPPKGNDTFSLDDDNKWIGAATIGYRYVF